MFFLSGCASPTPAKSPAPLRTPSASPQKSRSPEASDTPLIRPGFARMPGYEVSLSKVDPDPGDVESAARGFKLYRANCTVCHGSEENPTRSQQSTSLYMAHSRDLSKPGSYKFGSSDQALYRSIMFGIPRGPMGRYQGILTDQSVWDLINYIKSTWRR